APKGAGTPLCGAPQHGVKCLDQHYSKYTSITLCQCAIRRELEMSSISETPSPPYYAVIFTSVRNECDNGYSEMAARMVELAAVQPGFLGLESARENIGITVSYWDNLESIKKWKANSEHSLAQKFGHEKWYSAFKVRISKVEHQYGI
uniref:antibiotic biosynthesis monooxygenase family protein n=2 Tax=unclassified Endozoicomonas TaxID=2644528 RepID=UPI0027D22BEA